jgi:hypothetical protein
MNVGDRVVCIDDKMNGTVQTELFPFWLKKNNTYTIRRIEGTVGGEIRILLEEVVNPKAYFPELLGDFEPGFLQKRFVLWSEHVLRQAMNMKVINIDILSDN